MDEPYVVHHLGDKVRISAGEYKGKRGVIQAITGEELEVQLQGGGTARVSPREVTNFSLAARKAWTTIHGKGAVSRDYNECSTNVERLPGDGCQ